MFAELSLRGSVPAPRLAVEIAKTAAHFRGVADSARAPPPLSLFPCLALPEVLPVQPLHSSPPRETN